MTKKYTEGEVMVALMSNDTVRGAAETLGCSTRTVYNYVNADGFADRLADARAAREQVIAEAANRATVAALETLEWVLREDPTELMASVSVENQLEAARILLTHERSRSKVLENTVRTQHNA